MRLRTTVLIVLAFLLAAVAAAFTAGGAATIIEKRSRLATKVEMEAGGFGWVHVETDGLQVILFGTAPTEAERFRAVTRASAVVDASRIVDNTDVASIAAMAAPDFSVTMLRNDDGIQLIGLVPADTDRAALVATLRRGLDHGTVTDMLETAGFPAPNGWDMALKYAANTLQTIQRAKISVAPGSVRVEAMADSPTEKARLETSLARSRPSDLKLTSAITAPRPVITPFTLRFLIDKTGVRFDACSADSEVARDRILSAAREAGATGTLSCTIGMGTPSPQWADAVVMAIHALHEVGSGVVTFSDADVFLSANPDVPPAQYDHAIGEFESNLPKVFSLRTELQQKPEDKPGAPEFTAIRSEDGKVELRGRMTDERTRQATESYARAEFGATAVHGAMRLAPDMPQGWPARVMTALKALSSVSQGSVTVTPDSVQIAGVTGDPQASDTISRVLTGTLGEGAHISIDVRYDKRLDPILGLPDGPECVARLNDVLAAHKIVFEPGSAVISKDALGTLDMLAKVMKECQEFPMEIGGHTDSQGRDEMNMELSQDRAQSVLAALDGRGIWTGNLTAKGYGETQPIDTNDTDAGRENNRRIEFTLLDRNAVRAPADTASASADTPAETQAETQAAPTVSTADETTPKPIERPQGLVADSDAAPMDGTEDDDGAAMEPPMETPEPSDAPMDDHPMDGQPMDVSPVEGHTVKGAVADQPSPSDAQAKGAVDPAKPDGAATDQPAGIAPANAPSVGQAAVPAPNAAELTGQPAAEQPAVASPEASIAEGSAAQGGTATDGTSAQTQAAPAETAPDVSEAPSSETPSSEGQSSAPQSSAPQSSDGADQSGNTATGAAQPDAPPPSTAAAQGTTTPSQNAETVTDGGVPVADASLSPAIPRPRPAGLTAPSPRKATKATQASKRRR